MPMAVPKALMIEATAPKTFPVAEITDAAPALDPTFTLSESQISEKNTERGRGRTTYLRP